MVERDGDRVGLFAGWGRGNGGVIYQRGGFVFAFVCALHKGTLYQLDDIGSRERHFGRFHRKKDEIVVLLQGRI